MNIVHTSKSEKTKISFIFCFCTHERVNGKREKESEKIEEMRKAMKEQEVKRNRDHPGQIRVR